MESPSLPIASCSWAGARRPVPGYLAGLGSRGSRPPVAAASLAPDAATPQSNTRLPSLDPCACASSSLVGRSSVGPLALSHRPKLDG